MKRAMEPRVLRSIVNSTRLIFQDQRFLATKAAEETTSFKKPEGDNNSGQSTHFGFEDVKVEDKEKLVRGVFDNVAESYDVMNDLMSGGIHRVWKDYFVQSTCVESLARAVRRGSATSPATSGDSRSSELRILDVAGGTGDIAFRMIDAMQCEERSKSSGQDPVSVTVCDINTEMLRVGQRRARERYGSSLLDDTKALSFVEGNAQSLDKLQDNSFDLYTIAFGLRNVTDVDMALCEALRVLKPGGRFMCLEFSQVPSPILHKIYDVYSFSVIPAIGEMVANDRPSYQYLVESIRKFSDQETLVQRMQDAGFQCSKYTNLTGGIVAIHEGWKPT
jgi:ubiquinone/menaquinone biosynthesis methyltransferase